MTTTDTATHLDPPAADRTLKERHRAMWASGDYAMLAGEIIAGLGPALVDACRIIPGDRVHDVAAGAGNAAIPAALRGAEVVATDLTPELLDRGRLEAGRRDAAVEWRQADAEALPYGDDEFDVVMSCVGVMFAPHHQTAADELVRTCRPGGRIGLLSWTPEGFIGQMFAVMKPYAPPPPPGAQPPPLWGSEAHVRSLFGDQVDSIEAKKQTIRIDRFDTPEAFRDYFKSYYGPTIAVYRSIADDPDRTAALDQALVDLVDRFGQAPRLDQSSLSTVLHWEYLLFTARKV